MLGSGLVLLTPKSYVRYGVIKSDKKYILNAEDWNEKGKHKMSLPGVYEA